MRSLLSLAVLGGLVSAISAAGQPASAGPVAPAAAPVVPPRFVMTVPAGFEKISVGPHAAICEAKNAKWVREALAELDARPATRPTTMPSDLLKKVSDARAAVVKEMVADLALPDDKEATKLFAEQVIPILTKMEEMNPPVFYVIVTRERLKELCKTTGWSEPRFHYNRVADEVSVNERVMMSVDRPMDDTPLPAFYNEADPEKTRADKLVANVRQLDAGLMAEVARQSQLVVATKVMEHVGERLMEPEKVMGLKRDQLWLAYGAGGYFGCKYVAALTSVPRETWLKQIMYEDPGYPVGSRSIDLVKPMEDAQMRVEAQPFYRQAMRRKAVRAVSAWALDPKGGEASITKVLAAVRAKAPADGPALVRVVQEVGGVDLTKELGAEPAVGIGIGR